MRSRGTIPARIFAQTDRKACVALYHAKGIATSNPSMRPLVLKSFVGMNGRRTGKSTVPVITAAIAANDAIGPARR